MTPAKPIAAKKEKVFHPSSRKAGQLARKALRKGKLGNLVNNRQKKHNSQVDVYGFFYHALPEEGVLTLDDVHHFVDIWLSRFDDELELERSARRKGRPKSTKEMKLEEIKLRETGLYKTGMEVIDLTHQATVDLFRRWDQTEAAYIDLLRFIRISSTNKTTFVVSRTGRHTSIVNSSTPENQADAAMEVVEDQMPILLASDNLQTGS